MIQYIKLSQNPLYCSWDNMRKPYFGQVLTTMTLKVRSRSPNLITYVLTMYLCKVSKGAKIRNQYNQVPHLTQDTIGKVTNLQFDTTNESQEVSPFPAGDHKAQRNRHATQDRKNINDPQKKHRSVKNILLEGFNRTHGANLSLNSELDQVT